MWTWERAADKNGNPVIVFVLEGQRKLSMYVDEMEAHNHPYNAEEVATQYCNNFNHYLGGN